MILMPQIAECLLCFRQKKAPGIPGLVIKTCILFFKRYKLSQRSVAQPKADPGQ